MPHHSRQASPLQYRPGWLPWESWEPRPEIRGPLRILAKVLLALIAVLALLVLVGELW
jgi:hypothetical protein